MQPKAGDFGTDCSHPHCSHSVMAMTHLQAGTHTGCGNSADRLCPHRVSIKPVDGAGMEILEKWLCVTVNSGYPERVSGRVCGATIDQSPAICPLSLGSCIGWTWLPVLTSVTELCLS